MSYSEMSYLLEGLHRAVDHPIFNAIWFNIVWFLAVMGQYELLPLTVALILIHLLLVRYRRVELVQWAIVAFTGLAIDYYIFSQGVYIFEEGAYFPLWFCCLWFAFATTLNRCFKFLSSSYCHSSIVGAIGGALSYYAGYRLGAIEFAYSVPVMMVIIASLWAVLLPLFFFLLKPLEHWREVLAR